MVTSSRAIPCKFVVLRPSQESQDALAHSVLAGRWTGGVVDSTFWHCTAFARSDHILTAGDQQKTRQTKNSAHGALAPSNGAYGVGGPLASCCCLSTVATRPSGPETGNPGCIKLRRGIVRKDGADHKKGKLALRVMTPWAADPIRRPRPWLQRCHAYLSFFSLSFSMVFL